MSGKVDVQADYLSPAALQAEGGPTDSGQLRRWRASEAWRTAKRGSCQAMRVRPTCGSRGAVGWYDRLKVAHSRDANRPERFAG